MTTIIEAVPNVSEGRQTAVVEALVTAVSGVPGVCVLDVSSDASHNRTVLTLVGDASGIRTALLALYEHAIERIDLRHHRGQHPRIGAVDVTPLVPIQHATTADCVALARDLAESIGRRFDLPVYLYEDAATTPERRHLEAVRRGQFEHLAERMNEPGWQPDFGPARPHPTAGATAVGVRPILIAYNVNLDTRDLAVAREIASAVRERDGGLPFVKAMAVDLAPQPLVQVSMNVTNYQATPLDLVFDTVRREAARRGVAIRESEIVGMVPVGALLPAAVRALQLERFQVAQLLEPRLCTTLSLPPPRAV